MKSKYLYSSLLNSGLVLILAAIFSFGTSNQDFQNYSHKNDETWKSVSCYSSHIALNSILEESIEIPSFQIYPKLKGFFHNVWIPEYLDPHCTILNSPIFKKSIPLFDVKKTYFHFFYSW